MERKEYQTKLSDSYYRNEDELRETIDIMILIYIREINSKKE